MSSPLSFKVSFVSLALAPVLLLSSSISLAKGGSHQAGTRAKKTTRHNARHYRYGAYFVPPPPANMPSILPELAVRGASGESIEVKKPVNPYKKYIYSRDGYEAPAPVEVRKGVTTWSRSS